MQFGSMKISKYLHCCLVFELDSYKLLFDPGKFSFAEGIVKPEMFAGVNGIIICGACISNGTG